MSNVLHESSQASVSASLTQAVLHAASRLGLDRQALLSVCNLTDQQLADPDARIPFSVQQTLWHELDSRLQHPEPGLLLGRNLTPGPFSVLSYLLQSSATLGDALNAALRYQRLGGEGGELQLDQDLTGIPIDDLVPELTEIVISKFGGAIKAEYADEHDAWKQQKVAVAA